MTSFDDDLDAKIESALRDESWRPAPKGLYNRIEASLRVERARQRMRQRMAMRVASAVGVVVLCLAGIVGVSVSGHYVTRLLNSIPGGMGQFDHMLSSYALGPSPLVAIAVAFAAILPMAAAAAGAGALARQAQRARS